MEKVIIANITWNDTGWRNVYINPRAGHSYARKFPGHESLNFDFNKAIDKGGKVHGFVQWKNPPIKSKFPDGGVVFFYSKNLKTNKGEIVGIYGNAHVLRTVLRTKNEDFEDGELLANIEADEALSTLFPIPLHDAKYKKMLDSSRLVPQVGFRFINDRNVAKAIMADEIKALQRSGLRFSEKQKLEAIYKFVTGEVYEQEEAVVGEDINEQDELHEVLKQKKKLNKDKLIEELNNLSPSDPVLVEVSGKTYKRDSKTILSIKILRGFKCQLCGIQIMKADGGFYVEAGHIVPKREKGPETPDNIMILCPNHHKEFDYGAKKITVHNKSEIRFTLNRVEYVVKLSF